MRATRNDLPADTRETLIPLLNSRLADVIDLYAQCKHAHWNVKGPHFFSLHELFDRIAAGLIGHIDSLAERAVSLGGVAEGGVRTVAQRSTLAEYPRSATGGAEHVEAIATALATCGRQVRAAIEAAAAAGDADTADLFTEVSRDLDQWLWFVEAHTQ
jgi:starvation-inducible DNA-binding protein